jgi:hypothetical protein
MKIIINGKSSEQGNELRQPPTAVIGRIWKVNKTNQLASNISVGLEETFVLISLNFLCAYSFCYYHPLLLTIYLNHGNFYNFGLCWLEIFCTVSWQPDIAGRLRMNK